ncbi:fibronectin-binding protein [Mycolicibacterium boenickei]|nr:fibronectin-binding protein [Mycolicibacterium boenickei]
MTMRALLAAGLVALGVTSAVTLAGPAAAGPGDNPCGLAINLLCGFVPIAPELDHDIDLTMPPGPDNPVPASLVPSAPGDPVPVGPSQP